jgi:hypothetical protein
MKSLGKNNPNTEVIPTSHPNTGEILRCGQSLIARKIIDLPAKSEDIKPIHGYDTWFASHFKN